MSSYAGPCARQPPERRDIRDGERSRPVGFPPGPKGQWLLGNLPAYARDLLGFLTGCSQQYGDIVGLRLGATKAVLLNHPDQIEHVLVTGQEDFIKYRFFWRHVTRVFGNGLLTSSGDLWQHQHRLMAPAFGSNDWLSPQTGWFAAPTGFWIAGARVKSGTSART